MSNRNLRNEGTEKTGWSSFISGALIGGGVALLLTPQSGTELRGKICDYASRIKEDFLAGEAYDKGEDVIQDAGLSAKEFAKQGQETVQDVGRSAQEYAKQAQDVARDGGRSAL